ncbi:MAG: hypothetical protein J1E37_08930, partial [Prevotella sp.]|nr:hypothetical protein [Prevotella sp.]
YIICDNCFAMGHYHYFNNVAEYLASDAHASDNQTDEYALAADRINTGNATGTPACGQPWSTGTPGGDDITIPTDKSETTGKQIEVITTTKYYEITELIEDGRVFCEDLGQISTNDLDFNDAVFDAYVYRITPSTRTIIEEDGELKSDETTYGTPTYKTAIVLLAAGGTLELKVADKEVHNELGGNPISTIINTITSADEAHHNAYVFNSPVTLGTDFDYPSIADIPIWVRYGNGETLLLTAESGWAPHKILVPIGTKWCKERVDIATAYLDFKNYVGSSQNFWEGNTDDSKLYTNLTYNKAEIQRATGTVLVGTKTEKDYRNEGTSTTGGYEGETVLSRQLR